MSSFSTRPARRTPVLAAIGALLASALAPHDAHAQAPRLAEWIDPVSGDWTDIDMWSTPDAYPEDGQPAVYWWYTARLAARGAEHTVRLAQDVGITNLELDSPDATLHLDHAELAIRHDAFLDDGEILLDGATIRGGRWHMRGGSFRVLDAVTWHDLDVRDGDIRFDRGTVQLHDSLSLNGNAIVFGNSGTLRLHRMDSFNDRIRIEQGRLELAIDRPFTLGPDTHISGDTLYLRDISSLTNNGTLDLQGLESSSVDVVNNGSVTISRAPGDVFTPNAGAATFANRATILLDGVDFTLGLTENSGEVRLRDAHGSSIGLSANTGLIDVADTNGLYVSAAPGTVNGGTIRAARSDLLIGDGLTSLGVLELIDAEAEIQGDFTPATIGSISRTGDTSLYVHGFDTQGTTIDLHQTFAGNVRFQSLIGGTIVQSPQARLLGGTLERTTVLGGDLVHDLSDPDSHPFYIRDGLTLPDGDVRVVGAGYSTGILGFSGTQSITGYDVIVEPNPSGSSRVGVSQSGTTLTLAPDAAIRGAASFQANSAYADIAFVNDGLVTSTLPDGSTGGTLRFTGFDRLTNNGTMEAVASRIEILADQWTNEGEIDATDAVLTFRGEWRNHGIVSLTRSTLEVYAPDVDALGDVRAVDSTLRSIGTWDLGAETLDLSGQEVSLEIDGTLVGGTVVLAPGRAVSDAGGRDELIGTHVIGDVAGNGGTLTLAGAASFTGDLRFAPATSSTVDLNGLFTSIDFDVLPLDPAGPAAFGTVEFRTTGTTTIEPTTTIGGFGFTLSKAAHLVNRGSISAALTRCAITSDVSLLENLGTIDVEPGGSLSIGAHAFTNLATIRATDATLSLGSLWTNQGIIELHDSLLRLRGTYGPDDFGSIVVTGDSTVALDGSFDLDGRTFDLDPRLAWALSGGTTTGGVLNLSAGRDLIVSPREPGVLTSSSVRELTVAGGDVHVQTDARLHVTGALEIPDGSLRVDGWLELDRTITDDVGPAVGADLLLSETASIRWRTDAAPEAAPLIDVGGVARLGGRVIFFLEGGRFHPDSPAWYPLLLSSDYEGRFGSLLFFGPSDLRAQLRYEDEGVFLVVLPAPGVAGPLLALGLAGVGRRRPGRRRGLERSRSDRRSFRA